MCRFVGAWLGFLAWLSGAAVAGPVPSKDWFYVTEGEQFHFAATVNAAQHILGQYCYLKSGECMYLVGLGITCEEGHEVPALINSNAGAVQVQLVCTGKVQGQNVLAIKPFSRIDKVVREAVYLRIAVPMKNGAFKVSRFSLAGSTYAIEQMRAAVRRHMKHKPPARPASPKQDVEYL